MRLENLQFRVPEKNNIIDKVSNIPTLVTSLSKIPSNIPWDEIGSRHSQDRGDVSQLSGAILNNHVSPTCYFANEAIVLLVGAQTMDASRLVR